MFQTNDPFFKDNRKHLRNSQTKAENLLWQKIRARQLGIKFRRQFGISLYIVDFYCHSLKLIIEVDGYIHGEKVQKKYDIDRNRYLIDKGYNLIRYRNDQILLYIDEVVQDIVNTIEILQGNTPSNSP